MVDARAERVAWPQAEHYRLAAQGADAAGRAHEAQEPLALPAGGLTVWAGTI
ncbi:hypothetical protein [Bifidobacterium tibiigranuli]|uniref:hypothetical protein n=1 Tax=Bifidobacterium tibiigranuli TaxID=2172043 RepID=UPI002353792E|nr:hypothetical protein [Bifidobacterium tibiigranuli]MCH3975058.1 hypothetical protein [Bifidobacterium tibiigranuli]MCH4202818.1 hypothetical protein [Bifidobacterium tibiigranuli]MCH4274930.1 hypothetical protein [Bifidobacterium tibiigranuli]MCI1211017.1 hypothetical protein [Bifidobacterium tibiigranuli]MCI1221782.1 hypothetical protein [Bifidobacterium tibiigranuli]